MGKYLDAAGVTRLWTKIKETFATKANLTNGSVTKVGTSSVGNSTLPVYLNAGTPTACYPGESNLTWGGRNILGDISPVDAGCCDEFGHNKLAFLPASCLTVEYSNDGGVTWQDYGLSDAQKIAMMTTTGDTAVLASKNTVSAVNGTLTKENCQNYLIRITLSTRPLHSKNGSLYTNAKKLLINFSSQGASGCTCTLERQNVGAYNAVEDEYASTGQIIDGTWVTIGTYSVSGWSGWNSIPIGSYFGGDRSQTNNPIARMRMTFKMTGVNTTYSSCFAITDLRLIGTTNWSTPSELARAGHLYSFDTEKNATFPAKVTASALAISGGTATMFLKANGTTQGASDAASEMLSALPDWTANPGDTTKLVRRDLGETAAFGQITFLTVWNYIKSKADTVYATISALANKVDKEGGKTLVWESVANNIVPIIDDDELAGLTTNLPLYETGRRVAKEDQLANKADKSELAQKVDKIEGKSLSTNDYTTEDKNAVQTTKIGYFTRINDRTIQVNNCPRNIIENVKFTIGINDYVTLRWQRQWNISSTSPVLTASVNTLSTQGDNFTLRITIIGEHSIKDVIHLGSGQPLLDRTSQPAVNNHRYYTTRKHVNQLKNKTINVNPKVVVGRCIPVHPEVGMRYFFRDGVIKIRAAYDTMHLAPGWDYEDRGRATYYHYNVGNPVVVTITQPIEFEDYNLEDFEYDVKISIVNHLYTETTTPGVIVQNSQIVCVRRLWFDHYAHISNLPDPIGNNTIYYQAYKRRTCNHDQRFDFRWAANHIAKLTRARAVAKKRWKSTHMSLWLKKHEEYWRIQ